MVQPDQNFGTPNVNSTLTNLRNKSCVNNNLHKSKVCEQAILLCYLLYYSVSIDIVTDFPPFFEFVVAVCLHFSMLRVESWIKN